MLGPNAFEERILEAIECARSYGLDRSDDLITFAELAVAVGPRFDEHPPVLAILEDEDIPINERLDVVLNATPEAEWEAAARRSVGRQS